jgi:hypothetical protein
MINDWVVLPLMVAWGMANVWYTYQHYKNEGKDE